MNPSGVLFTFAMVFAVACYSATTETGDTITTEILAAIEHEALIVDVRTPEEFADGHYPGAINIPHESILDGLNQLFFPKHQDLQELASNHKYKNHFLISFFPLMLCYVLVMNSLFLVEKSFQHKYHLRCVCDLYLLFFLEKNL